MTKLDSRVAAYMQLSGRDVFPVDDTRLATPEVKALWHWWSAAAGSSIPERHAFDIAEHARLAPNLYLLDRVPHGFRLRLAGDAFVQMFNRRKGHEWRDDAPEPLIRAFAGYFDFVAESGRAWHSLGSLECSWSDWFRFESLLCPLRHEGDDQLLGIAVTLKED